MFGLGTHELLIILAVALIVFGPKKLPEIGRAIGQGMRELRKASRDIMDAVEYNEEPEPAPPTASDPVSDRPLDQMTDQTECWVHDQPTDEAVAAAPEISPVSDQEKESVQNAADSNRN